MGYSAFQSQGPVISPSLFGDAARTGIALGQAIPSPITSIVNGAISGYETGQQIQSNDQKIEIQQHQIDQQPVEDQIRQEQLKQQQTANEINQLQLQLDTQTQDQALALKKQELITKTQESKKKSDDMANQQAIAEKLSSPDPVVRRSVLTAPALYGTVISSGHDYADRVFGQLSKDMTPQEQDQAFKQLDFSKAMEEKGRRDTALAENNQKLLAKKGDTLDTIAKDGQLNYLFTSNGLAVTDAGKIETYPAGIKRVDPTTGLLDRSSKDQDSTLIPGSAGKYDVFINGKKAPFLLDETSNNNLATLKATYRAAGIPVPPASLAVTNTVQNGAGPASRLLQSQGLGSSATDVAPTVAPQSKINDSIVQQRKADLDARAQEDPILMNRLREKGTAPIERGDTKTDSAFVAPISDTSTVPDRTMYRTAAEVKKTLPQSAAKRVNPDIVEKVLNEPLLNGKEPIHLAIAAVESEGKRNAKSPTGADGLFQLTGPAIADINQRAKKPEDMVTDRKNPAQNVNGGISYFERLKDKYNGAEVPALMAYNIGEGVIDSAKQMTNSVDYHDLLDALQYFKDHGLYGKYVTDATLKAVREYPLKVLAYKQAFQEMSYA